MDDLLAEFINANYPYEFIEEIFKSLQMFKQFGLLIVEDKLSDIISNPSNTTSELSAGLVRKELNDNLDYILREHTIVLSEEATYSQKNIILDALLRIQDLEDYNGIISILESLEEDYLKFAIIIEDLTSMDKVDTLSILESLDVTVLDKLKQYIYQKTEDAPIEDPTTEKELSISRLKIFCELFGDNNAGYLLLESGFEPGFPLDIYLPYIEDELQELNGDQLVQSVLSIIYLSDSASDPLTGYRKYSSMIFTDSNLANRVEEAMLKLINKINEQVKITTEVNKLRG